MASTVYRRNLWLVGVCAGCFLAALWPVVQILFFGWLGLGPADIGILLAASSGTAVATQVLGGLFADRFGRKAALVMYGALSCAASVVLAQADSFGIAFVGMVTWGVAFSFYGGVSISIAKESYVAMGHSNDSANAQLLTFALKVRLSSNIIGLIAAVMAGVCAQVWGYRSICWMTAGIFVVSIVAALCMIEPPHNRAETPRLHEHITQSMRIVFGDSFVRVRALGIIVLAVPYMIVREYYGLHLVALGVDQPFWQSWFRWLLEGTEVLAGTLTVIGSKKRFKSIGAALKKYTAIVATPRYFGIALGAVAASLLMLGLPWIFTVAGYVVLTFVFTLLLVQMYIDFMSQVPSHVHSSVQSVFGMFRDIAITVAIVGFGVMSESSGVQMAFLGIGVVIAVYAMWHIVRYRHLA